MKRFVVIGRSEIKDFDYFSDAFVFAYKEHKNFQDQPPIPILRVKQAWIVENDECKLDEVK